MSALEPVAILSVKLMEDSVHATICFLAQANKQDIFSVRVKHKIIFFPDFGIFSAHTLQDFFSISFPGLFPMLWAGVGKKPWKRG